MERRTFIKQSAVISSGSIVMPNQVFSNETSENDVLKGFIVSDAHFGWNGKVQPKPELQAKAMKNIIERFPDLDLFFDTGDAHHNDHHNNLDPYKARQDWIDIIQGGCGQTPFYYVIGNHEIYSDEVDEPEMRCNIMGSNTCRPYYSFDIQGIHFISFPELITAIYITTEEWDWLELDLALNREKTIVMLSHNNILGTTKGNGPGYRGLMDSEKMMQIFKENPNVISWMHGHNHNYEVVKMQDMLYVSNGRIGGFDPNGGKYGIGGIYFEISANGLTVKCYSAQKDCFLDQFDSTLSQTLKKKTSFNPEEKSGYCYGVGGAKNGERIPAYHHNVGENSNVELFLTGCEHPVINDDPEMTKYVERKAFEGLDKILFAAAINHGNEAWEYLNPGIRLKANSNWWTTVTMPCDNFSRFSYYRCPVGCKYKVSIDIDVKGEGKQQLWLRLHVHNIDGRVLRIVQSESFSLGSGRQKKECIIEVPEINDSETIYNNPDSDKLVNIAIEASFSNMRSDIDVFAIKLELENSGDQTTNAGMIVDGIKYGVPGLLKKGEIARVSLNKTTKSRSVNEIIAEGNKRLTFILRHTNLSWQVRNATVKYQDGYMDIDKIRNRLSDKMEIVIVPLQKIKTPYLHRIRKAEQIRFYPFTSKNKVLNIEIKKVYQGAELEIFSKVKPLQVNGVEDWTFNENIILARIDKPVNIHIQF